MASSSPPEVPPRTARALNFRPSVFVPATHVRARFEQTSLLIRNTHILQAACSALTSATKAGGQYFVCKMKGAGRPTNARLFDRKRRRGYRRRSYHGRSRARGAGGTLVKWGFRNGLKLSAGILLFFACVGLLLLQVNENCMLSLSVRRVDCS